MSSTIRESMEAIAFQKHSQLPAEITARFQRIIDIKCEQPETDRIMSDICAITLEATGVWLEPRWTSKSWIRGGYEISVKASNLNALSPINHAAVKRLQNYDVENMKATDLLTGTVDYGKGKLTGFYSKIRHDMYMTPSLLDGSFTARELTALYFHEAGHGWTYLAFMGETLATNVILAEIVGQYDFQDSVEKKYIVGKAALKLSGIDIDLPLDTDSADLTALVLQGQVTRMQRQADTRWYDIRLSECIADQFSARWMMAGPLVTALSKLERSQHIFADPGYEPAWYGIFSNVLHVCTFPFSDAVRGAAFVVNEGIRGIANSFVKSYFATSVCIIMFNTKSYTPMAKRIPMIRREMVSLLRDPKLEPEVREAALADIKVIDDEFQNVHPFTDVYGTVARYVIGLVGGRSKELGRHDMIENLANNRLYEFSAKLKGTQA